MHVSQLGKGAPRGSGTREKENRFNWVGSSTMRLFFRAKEKNKWYDSIQALNMQKAIRYLLKKKKFKLLKFSFKNI